MDAVDVGLACFECCSALFTVRRRLRGGDDNNRDAGKERDRNETRSHVDESGDETTLCSHFRSCRRLC